MENAMEQLTLTRELTAGQVMHQRFASIRPDATLRELAALLSYYGIMEMPVVHSNGLLMGTAAASDLFQLAAEESGAPIFHIPREPAYIELERAAEPPDDAESWRSYVEPVLDRVVEMLDRRLVADIMTPVTVSLPPTATTSEIAYVILRAKVDRAPVVRNGRLLGMVTLTDLLRAVSRPGHTRSWEADEPFKVPVALQLSASSPRQPH